MESWKERRNRPPTGHIYENLANTFACSIHRLQISLPNLLHLKSISTDTLWLKKMFIFCQTGRLEKPQQTSRSKMIKRHVYRIIPTKISRFSKHFLGNMKTKSIHSRFLSVCNFLWSWEGPGEPEQIKEKWFFPLSVSLSLIEK